MSEEKKIEVQQVDAVLDPRARVENAAASTGASAGDAPRTRDYLDGFLKETPPGVTPGEPGGEIYEAVIATLREIFDPEIPVNIYDLGLIYGVDVNEDNHVTVTMTLTTPHCPVAESMPSEVELRVGTVPGVGVVDVNLVWDPPWDPQKMSDEARLELGML